MSDTTPRFGLPLLAGGQAQKEVTHNEALILIDLLAQPVIESAALTAPPVSPTPGQAWIIAVGATGEWLGHAGKIALATEGGWRFIAAPEGTRAIIRSNGLLLRRGASTWHSGEPIDLPSGGPVQDTGCRAAIGSLIVAMQHAGFIAA